MSDYNYSYELKHIGKVLEEILLKEPTNNLNNIDTILDNIDTILHGILGNLDSIAKSIDTIADAIVETMNKDINNEL